MPSYIYKVICRPATQMQVDACELKTCEWKVILYEKIAFEFRAKQNYSH